MLTQIPAQIEIIELFLTLYGDPSYSQNGVEFKDYKFNDVLYFSVF